MMRTRRSKTYVRRALHSWMPWLPLLVVFVVIAMDARLNIHSRRTDYEFNELNAERRQLISELESMRPKIAEATVVSRLAELAKKLGLVPPNPDQIEVLALREKAPEPVVFEKQPPTQLEMAATPKFSPETSVKTGASVPMKGTFPEVLAPKVNLPMQSASATSGSILPAAAATPKQIILDLPKETIADLDSTDTSGGSLLSSL